MKRATKQRLSLAAIMVLLLSGCGSVGKETKKQEQQVLRVGIDSELSTADVSLAMDNTAADVMKLNQHWQLKKYSPPMMV